MMFARILIATIAISLGACATSGPETPAPAPATAPADGTAQAQSTTDATQTAQVASEDYDPNEKVCRRERETGSSFTTRICRTRAEIEERKKQDQVIVDSMRINRSGGDCALNGNC